MPVEGRGLSSRQTRQVARDRRLGNLATPKSVQKLQTALHAKAKAEAGYRFYALYDKISREDILAHAYAQCRSNKGAPGVDGQDFADIEAYGMQRWLREQGVSGDRQLHRGAVAPVVAYQAQGQTTKGRDLSALAPLRALRARTPNCAWTRRVVGEGVKFCPRAGCRRSARPGSTSGMWKRSHG